MLYYCVSLKLGDNCIQNLHLGRYIIRYLVGNLAPCEQAVKRIAQMVACLALTN